MKIEPEDHNLVCTLRKLELISSNLFSDIDYYYDFPEDLYSSRSNSWSAGYDGDEYSYTEAEITQYDHDESP